MTAGIAGFSVPVIIVSFGVVMYWYSFMAAKYCFQADGAGHTNRTRQVSMPVAVPANHCLLRVNNMPAQMIRAKGRKKIKTAERKPEKKME